MKVLINSAEVAALAFPGTLDPTGSFINESSIVAAQQKFLKPVLGAQYENITGTLLTDYVKPALAQWVRYLVLPSIAAQVGSTGVIAPRGQSFETVSPMSAAALRARTKADARALTRRMVEYVEANPALYPDYKCDENVLSRVSTTGGVVL